MKFNFRSASPSYTLVHDEEGKELLGRTRGLAVLGRAWKFLLWTVLSSIMFGFAFCMGRRTSLYTDPHFPIQLPTIVRTLDYSPAFAVAPSNASNAAWASLYPKGGTFFSHSPEFKHRSTLSVFHQLHCLDAIRQAYYVAYDAAIRGEKLEVHSIPEMAAEEHVRHCVEFIRQILTCMADRTIEKKNEAGGVTGFGTTHRCADYGELVRKVEQWHKENGEDLEVKTTHAHDQHPH